MNTIDGVIAVLLDKWVRRLGLTEWEILVSIVDSKKMKKTAISEVKGCVEYELFSHKANIFLLDKLDEIEIEPVIVHELLHLCFSDHDRFYVRIIDYVGDEAVQELLNKMRTDQVERLLHIISSSLLREKL